MASSPSTDTSELKSLIYQRIGHEKADLYFCHLNRFFSYGIEKDEFDKLCIDTMGREHIHLHNRLMQSILKNSTCTNATPRNATRLEGSLSNSVRKSRTPINRKSSFREPHGPSPLGPQAKKDPPSKLSDRTSPIGPLAKTPCATSNGKLVIEEDSGEDEVELITLPRLITEPLGVSVKPIARETTHLKICTNIRDLPGTNSLMSHLEKKVAEEKGLGVSMDYADLLSKGLNVYLKSLIEPLVVSARSRCIKGECQPSRGSMEDFFASVETNPQTLGADWPRKLEKVSLGAMLEADKLRGKKVSFGAMIEIDKFRGKK